jgi:hypothetical protein
MYQDDSQDHPGQSHESDTADTARSAISFIKVDNGSAVCLTFYSSSSSRQAVAFRLSDDGSWCGEKRDEVWRKHGAQNE